MPIGLIISLTLWTGNLAYIYISVAYIQMLKASSPVIMLGMTFMMGMVITMSMAMIMMIVKKRTY